jgi:hypothetical protein
MGHLELPAGEVRINETTVAIPTSRRTFTAPLRHAKVGSRGTSYCYTQGAQVLAVSTHD